MVLKSKVRISSILFRFVVIRRPFVLRLSVINFYFYEYGNS